MKKPSKTAAELEASIKVEMEDGYLRLADRYDDFHSA
jgi:hypothetical protein